MSDEKAGREGWEAGTWEGARRAQLKRALKRTVRERLEVLEELTETNARLAEIRKSAEHSEDG